MIRLNLLLHLLALSLLSLVCLSVGTARSQSRDYQQHGNSILCGDARFQLLSPMILRMEHSPNRRFTDAPTVVVLDRKLNPPKFTVQEKEGWLVISTKSFTMKYRVNSGTFNPENLHVTWENPPAQSEWSPGDSDRQNLGSIWYSLDGVRKGKLPQFHPGILSRSGWFLLDDSKSPVWTKDSSWIAPRDTGSAQDWYLFVYRKDFAGALKEYARLCGRIPMIPRYALGSWITDLNYEYLPGTPIVDKYRYTSDSVKTIVQRFEEEGIPLDVLVLDFAWHRFGWKGGYDWSPIFSDPHEFLSWAHSKGIKISLNDHPGYGEESVLSDDDSHAKEVRAQLNLPVLPEPLFSIDISKGWKFRTDTADVGLKAGWQRPDFRDTSWNTINGGKEWEDQGYPGYDGYAWYRKTVDLPQEYRGGPLFLIFGGVDDEYDLFINGNKAGHHGSPNNSVYSTLTSTDISSRVRPGEPIRICLRVNDWGGGGGLVALPIALADRPPGKGIRFNLAEKKQADVFMDVLHDPLVDEGVDFWWIDGGRGSCEMEGLNGQLWTNRVFYDFTEKHTNRRAFIFSRYGGWGNHRYPGCFTGDTYSEWPVLGYEVPFTEMGGNVLMPFITHDIGGFHGAHIDFDLYIRWIQFGVFSPILRLHSSHENPEEGNARMPWNYAQRGIDMVRDLFRLRYRLLPYIYTCCRTAHDDALPIVRPLYLEYPNLDRAYDHPGEYFFGKEFLVAPVTDSTGVKSIYLPPGTWYEFGGTAPIRGDTLLTRTYSLQEIPLFVREGSIIPMQPDMAYSGRKVPDTLMLDLYAGGGSRFTLYEDDGVSLDYRQGKYMTTLLRQFSSSKGALSVTIGPARGAFNGRPVERTYILTMHGCKSPHSVLLDGRRISQATGTGPGWRWDDKNSTLMITLEPTKLDKKLDLVIR